MPNNSLALSELSVAVQNAVEQVLGQHGAVSVGKLWVGFVAPDQFATQENAGLVAAELARKTGVKAEASVAQLAPAAVAGREAHAIRPPGHIIGLVFAPTEKKA